MGPRGRPWKGSTSGTLFFPTATGEIARLAVARLEESGINPEPLLARAELTLKEIEDRSARLSVRRQIRFLDLAGSALQDELFGFHLALSCDLRQLGLLYYVPASSNRLGDALSREVRYVSMVNEALSLEYVQARDDRLILKYVGVARHSDRHQLDFCFTILIRLCRHLTRRHLVPIKVRVIHGPSGSKSNSKLSGFFGSDMEFGARVDEITFASNARDIPIATADPHLNEVLIDLCEETMAHRPVPPYPFESRVQNAIAPLLPHGRVDAGEIARQFGMSRRTLVRQLASEGLTFRGLLEALQEELARRYLADRTLPISKITWLLGYRQVSAFTTAFKRWTGKTPFEMRLELQRP